LVKLLSQRSRMKLYGVRNVRNEYGMKQKKARLASKLKLERDVLAAIYRCAIKRYEEVRATEVSDGQADTKPATREGR
jgi:hypothetical protein